MTAFVSSRGKTGSLSTAEEGMLTFVASLPIFGALPAEAVAALARSATRRHYKHNDFVYMQDDEATHLFLVMSGYVRLSYLMEDGSAVIYNIHAAHDSFGELGVYENSTYCDMATAAGPMTAACIPISTFRTVSRSFPDVSAALSRTIAKRYRSYILLTRDLSLNSLAARLAQALIRLADSMGTLSQHNGEQVRCIASIVTQTDLGLMARGSRGNVNRALKAWERLGWIALTDRSIMILRRKSLESVAFEVDA